jgi:cyclopropane-fatty-acyl-phospholipid synthase
MARLALEQAARRWRVGTLCLTYPDGRRRAFGSGKPEVHLRARGNDLFPALLFGGEIGLGDAYVDGLWDSEDLPGLLELGLRNRRALALNRSALSLLPRLGHHIRHRHRKNTRAGSRRNIAAHYDLSNEFYRLWLDESMTYSCAVFRSPDEGLADAQVNKLEAICQRAGLEPGQRVLEIGGGWGSFAIHAARSRRCTVTSLTVSRAQLELAARRVREAGLQDPVELRLEDYRDARGAFDRIVSIEMFEAVGVEYFETFFRACDRLLRPGGLLALQTIAVPERAFPAQEHGVNWIQLRIFPGSALPSLAAIERALGRTSLQIREVADIGLHYAETLRRWRERFHVRLTEVRALGFDERFIRTWDYYLASSEASFRARNTVDLQIVLAKTG